MPEEHERIFVAICILVLCGHVSILDASCAFDESKILNPITKTPRIFKSRIHTHNVRRSTNEESFKSIRIHVHYHDFNWLENASFIKRVVGRAIQTAEDIFSSELH